MEAAAFDPVSLLGARYWNDKQRKQLMSSLCKHVSVHSARYNLCGVYLEGTHAAATDGHRLLVVGGLDDIGASGKILQVHGKTLSPWLIEGQFPDWRQIVKDPSRLKHEFSLGKLRELRKMRGITVGITKDGLSFAAGGRSLCDLNLSFISDLPATDDELIVTFGDPVDPVVIRPAAGGWFAVVMQLRIDGTGTALTWLRGGA